MKIIKQPGIFLQSESEIVNKTQLKFQKKKIFPVIMVVIFKSFVTNHKFL